MKRKYSLITWEYKREGDGVVPVENAFVLVKYVYSDTDYTRKEIYSTIPNRPHYADYETEIYQNQFLINARGDIFDLKSNKMIHDHIGYDAFIEKNGDSIFFYHLPYTPEPPFHNDTARHNAIKTQLYVFDLKSRQIIQLKGVPGRLWVSDGILSPDRKRVANFVPPGNDTAFNISSKKDSSLYECGWAQIIPIYGDVLIKSSSGDSIRIFHSALFDISLRPYNFSPIKWLNNNELLFQKKNGSLSIANITSNTLRDLPLLENVIPCSFTSRFEENYKNEILYYCKTKNGDIFKVNTITNSLEPVSKISISQNYSLRPYDGLHSSRREYVNGYYNGDEKMTSDTTTTFHYSVTPEELIAIQCKEAIPSRNQYDHWNTIRIFDPSEKKWTNIKIEYLQRLVGWVQED